MHTSFSQVLNQIFFFNCLLVKLVTPQKISKSVHLSDASFCLKQLAEMLFYVLELIQYFSLYLFPAQIDVLRKIANRSAICGCVVPLGH